MFLIQIKPNKIQSQLVSDTQFFQHLAKFYYSNDVYRRTVIVTAAVYRSLSSEPFTLRIRPFPLTYRHWASVSPYTSAFAFAGTCVFDKQSTSKLLVPPQNRSCGNPSPEVTGSFFAEFLKPLSLAHLSLLDQPTCGGLRYGLL